MAEGCKYFCEDSVFRENTGILEYGVITENAEYVSSDDDEPENERWFQKMKKGQVRVAWHPTGHEQVLPESKINLADRSLLPGDVVRRLNNKHSVQCGYCTYTSVKADIKLIGLGQIICDINSDELISLMEFEENFAVVLDSWIGVIEKVNAEVIMKTPGGSRCVMSYDDAANLVDVQSKNHLTSDIFRKENIYPKQKLVGPAAFFQTATWISKASDVASTKTKPDKSIRVTVEKIRTKSIVVHWQGMGFSLANESFDRTPPQSKIEGDILNRIKILNVLESSSLQIGDKKLYVLKDGDQVISTLDWLRNEWTKRRQSEVTCINDVLPSNDTSSLTEPNSGDRVSLVDSSRTHEDQTRVNNGAEHDKDHRLNRNQCKDNDASSEYEDLNEVQSDAVSVSSRSTTDLNKAKGAKSKKSASLATSLLRRKKLKKARRKDRNVDEIASDVTKPGDKLIVEALKTATFVNVMWQNGELEKEIPACELYPVHYVDDHEYFPGDFIIENRDGDRELIPSQYGVIQSVNYNARTAHVNWMRLNSDAIPRSAWNEEVSVYDLSDHPDFSFRPQTVVIRIANLQSASKIIAEESSPGGQVVSLSTSGMVEIQWAGQNRSFCYPQELNIVGEYDSDDSIFGDSSYSSEISEDSWETESEESADSSNSPSDCNVQAKKIQRWMQEVIRLNAVIQKFIKFPIIYLTKQSIRPIFDAFKKLRAIDSQLGSTHFDNDELKTLAKQIQERSQNNKLEAKLERMTDMFGVSSEDALELFEDLDLLKLSWVQSESKKDDGSCGYDHSASKESSEKNSKTTSDDDGASKLSKAKKPSKKELLTLFLFKLRVAIVSLSKDLIELANENISTCNEQESGNEEEQKIFQNIVKRCGEVVEGNDSSRDADAVTSEVVDVHMETETGVKNSVDDCLTVEESNSDECLQSSNGFSMIDSVPDGHKFKLMPIEVSDARMRFKAIRKELSLLKNDIPDGILVKGFDDHMDLFSVLIKGPTRTPYEDGIFLFDLQLPGDYPISPPLCHYVSFCSDRLNPNLYEDGKVCLSLLGTWGGKGTEVWTSDSNLLQLIISIQGLILVPEPYYNEPGTEAQKNSTQGKENSRLYNEMAVLKLMQSMVKLFGNISETFKEEIIEHYKTNVPRMIRRFEKWIEMSEKWNEDHPETPTSPTVYREIHSDFDGGTDNFYLPEFPLLPASRGFCLSMNKVLKQLKTILKSNNIIES